MPACAVCGYQAAEAFKFCPECGAAAATRASEQRKVVTVVFCDVVSSTALGETTDPEAVRALLARYFERMKAIVERHGGTVEKFIGDAVMAVFGIPVAHEDDALRACRAAVEMREALPELEVEGRIGVVTGEVVTGTEERLATGDAVNVAARLQQAAQPGEALIGEETLALVGGAAEVEAVESLALKGKAEPVPAFRLLAVNEAPERRPEARFVGRERELAAIHAAWERALAERGCELVTIVGEAGVGKSRLVAEALASLAARVVQGRCLPYGEGITYWPVVEILKQLGALPSDAAAAAAVRSLLGETDAATSGEEIAWAVRKLLEEQAPLVVVVDDIQWGEQTFLDLVEHVGLLSAGAPILLLCMARPDLLERRKGWSVTLRLEPLPEEAVKRLMPEEIGARLSERIARAAGGNPLFVEELVAMALEAHGPLAMPPTLRAVLAARLDQLNSDERRVLEYAAVEGEVFHRGAVHELAGGEDQITPQLAALVRRELISPYRAQLPGEDGFRFRHLLIRDVAYEALTKSNRAELHRRLAAWLEQQGPGLVEVDEISGYHLEQAAHYTAELGKSDPALAERAGEHLAAAGRRALWREDEPAAASLLERALKLTRRLHLDVRLELDFAQVFRIADPPRAAALAEAAAEQARAAGDEAGEALARLLAAEQRFLITGDTDVEELEVLARAALSRLEQEGDHAGLARVWNTLAFAVANTRGRYEDMAQAAEHTIRHARLAGQPFGNTNLTLALVAGPRPADEALRLLEAALPENLHPVEMLLRAALIAMLGRFDEAWPLAYEANERLREMRGDIGGHWLGEIAIFEGDHQAAANHFRRACDAVEARGLRNILSGLAPRLARELCALGRYDEAEPLAQRGRRLAEGYEDDVWVQQEWRQAQALLDAARGNSARAERLAREALAIAERTDSLNSQGDVLCDLAQVLASAGRSGEAATALEHAIERYEQKKNLAMVAQARGRLAALTRQHRSATATGESRDGL